MGEEVTVPGYCQVGVEALFPFLASVDTLGWGGTSLLLGGSGLRLLPKFPADSTLDWRCRDISLGLLSWPLLILYEVGGLVNEASMEV